MSISTKIPSSTVIDYSTGVPKPDSELVANRNAPLIAIGNAPASSIKVGNFLVGENNENLKPTYSKVTNITSTPNTACKNITFVSGLVLKVAAESTINVGDTVSGAYGVDHVVQSVEDTAPETVFEFTLEGSGNFLSSGIIIS